MEPIRLRKIGKEAVKNWNIGIKQHNIKMMLDEGTLFVCPVCNVRLTWSPEVIMAKAQEKHGEDEERCLQFYWSRVGWCEGHKFEMADDFSDGQECHVCRYGESMIRGDDS